MKFTLLLFVFALFANTLTAQNVEAEYQQLHTTLTAVTNPDFGLQMAGSFATFREFQAHVSERLQPLRDLLSKADAEFRATNTASLNRDENAILFRFAWAKRLQGERMDADADFVNFVRAFNLNDEYNLPLAGQILRWNLGVTDNPENENATILQMQFIQRNITNQAVINRLAFGLMRGEMSSGGGEDLSRVFAFYNQLATDANEQTELIAIYNQLVTLAQGAPAVDFEMQDIDGNTVRFLDVIGQGKVVYINFWATWCGPCRTEKPHFSRLAEKHKGNPNIEFISISLDNNLRRWHSFLEAEDMPGRQFIVPAAFESEFSKIYNVRGIPRFMAFDKDGKIISINAPRPSSPNIEAFLEVVL